LEALSRNPGKTIKASNLVIRFIGIVLSEELGGEYAVSFARFVEVCSELLRLDRDLYVASKPTGKYLVSSKGFKQRFDVKVRISLDGTEGFPKVAE
jgi:hypothetical protein